MPVSKIFDIDDGWPSRNCNPAAPGFWQNRSAATYCPPADLSLPLGPSVGENGALFFTPGLPTSNPRRRIAMPSRRERANAIRALSMDAVQKANSGHPGAPMGMADIAEVLWRDYMQHNPSNPQWANRDRFVLSNGHGSMLIYSLLHLAGRHPAPEQADRLLRRQRHFHRRRGPRLVHRRHPEALRGLWLASDPQRRRA